MSHFDTIKKLRNIRSVLARVDAKEVPDLSAVLHAAMLDCESLLMQAETKIPPNEARYDSLCESLTVTHKRLATQEYDQAQALHEAIAAIHFNNKGHEFALQRVIYHLKPEWAMELKRSTEQVFQKSLQEKLEQEDLRRQEKQRQEEAQLQAIRQEAHRLAEKTLHAAAERKSKPVHAVNLPVLTDVLQVEDPLDKIPVQKITQLKVVSSAVRVSEEIPEGFAEKVSEALSKIDLHF